ncbi:MAG: very short patch repair endonuclease [Methanoregula sp.]|nr:very short patch repair endonuclease [Methanoregula sp.]
MIKNNFGLSMADVLNEQQRKHNMSRIRGKNTGPEIKLRKMLWSHGIRGYRIHHNMPGKPDIVFIKKKIAIFIDGCFWHKCPIDFQEPETRKEFWMKKINSNVERDKKITKKLQEEGWTVIRFWEHEVRKKPEEVIEKILLLLHHS